MSELKWIVLVGAAAIAGAACGGGVTGPAELRNDPGTGSATLRVMADIEGTDIPTGFATEFRVTVRDGLGAPVSEAAVTVRNPRLGTVTLTETVSGSGDYVAARNTFASGDYRLDVVRGDDNVRGVVVGGISAHVILSPEPNDVVPAGEPLTVTWSRPVEALGADLETRDFSIDNLPDSGTYTIPGEQNPPREDQRIRVWRFNQVEIAGGLTGSRLKLSVRHTVEPIVVE